MTPWDKFFSDKVTQIFNEKKSVVDIGGGLRALKERGNRFQPDREWIAPLIKKVDYKILDPVDTYQPDIVGDIHSLPFEDDSQEAIVCMAVLEHVENPFKAVAEMYRVLKPGGYCLVYTPFLFYYHAEVGYYKDYWRFSHDAIELLYKDFSHKEIANVRGAIGTWLHISPLGKSKILAKMAIILDKWSNKTNSKQTSGYNIFLVK